MQHEHSWHKSKLLTEKGDEGGTGFADMSGNSFGTVFFFRRGGSEITHRQNKEISWERISDKRLL